MDLSAWILVLLGILIFLAHLFGALFERTRIPDVFPLVLVGLLLGPVSGLLPSGALGRIGNVFTTAALVLILFEGGLDLNLSVLTRSLSGAVRLALANVAITTLAVALLASRWLAMDSLAAVTLGTIASATSSAVVIPMVSRFRMTARGRTVLVVEAALSDVVCIVLVLGYLGAIGREGIPGPAILGRMLSSLLLAIGLGGAAGVLWALLLERVRSLQTSMITTPAFLFVVFGITEILGFSGAIAALTFGFVMGNTDTVERGLSWFNASSKVGHLIEAERSFFAELVFVMKTFFFVFIGIQMPLRNPEVLLAGLAIVGTTALMRIPIVRVACPRDATVQDASLASVMVPKGLASAVLASLAVEAGLPQGEMVRDLSYAIILFSVLVTAAMAFLVERGFLAPLFRFVFRGRKTFP